ncbi:hypothetical protein DXG03_006246 [Asterophora parasitica]|uniref:glucan 1,4-alpha-glucosidase n=1 Tax=Asterophora parasitica TaxID=117018 RepID=A0A9P7G7A8_9AGAR|nr:hypothetical protein DXG03_006246 [Asterophora parasitica]
MRWSLLPVLLSLVSVGVYGQSSTVDTFLAAESPIAKANLLANIGPSGSKSQGAKAGVVIASPSRSDPDYVYTWTRDSALVFQAIIEQYAHGPALRAVALITWANHLLTQSNSSYVTGTLWPIIKLDLDYVASNWNLTGFDLWEEVSSSSFFTTAVQHRALRQGAALATAIGQPSAVSGYTTQAANALCFLQSYWNPSGYMTANTGGGRSGRDANTVLTSIHTFDAAAGCDATTFQPCSDRALANLLVYVNAFRIYTINNGIPANQGLATGRYPEDSYYGGNPWYLTTLAVAEQLYDALIVWKAQGSLIVTALSQPFFANLSPGVAVGTYASTTSTFTTLTTAVKTYADSFVAVVAKYTPANGALAEQYTRNSGAPTSAADLTWSYAALLTAVGARKGVVPKSWGAAGLTVPTTCERNTGGGGGGGGTPPGGGGTVTVSFNVQATTIWGENIYITGSVDGLANWSPNNALLLSADSYPIWKITVTLPASTSIQYKYIRKFNGAVTWESDPNRQFTTPASGSYTLNDSWK